MNAFFASASIVIMLCSLSSCSFNISMAHTSGTATDVIDDTMSNDPKVSPTITLPLKLGP